MITEVHQQGRFYRLSTGRAAHYEIRNLTFHYRKTGAPPSRQPQGYASIPVSTEGPQNMEGLQCLLVEPACKVNEKDTREKNDGNENVSMNDNEKIEEDSDKGSFAEADWIDPEQKEVPKWTEPDLQMTKETRKGGRKRTGMRYNRYGDDVLIDKIQPEEIGEELVNVGELVANEERQIINDSEHSLQEDHSMPEREMNLEHSEIERRENTPRDTGMDA